MISFHTEKILRNQSNIKKYCYIIIGSLLYSIGVAVFLNPNAIAPGGIMGIAILISKLVNGTPGTWYLLINIPIIVLGWIRLGSNFIYLSAISVVLNSYFTNLIEKIYYFKGDLISITIAGSIIAGIGLGMVLKAGASTGGMDIIVKILRLKYPMIKTSTIFMISDLFVITLFGIVFLDFNIIINSFISIITVGYVLDYILYGSDEAKLFIIITEEKERVSSHIINDIGISATILDGEGAFSKRDKNIILCVVKKRNSPQLEDIIKDSDRKAFIIITRATEIYGEGYKSFNLSKM